MWSNRNSGRDWSEHVARMENDVSVPRPRRRDAIADCARSVRSSLDGPAAAGRAQGVHPSSPSTVYGLPSAHHAAPSMTRTRCTEGCHLDGWALSPFVSEMATRAVPHK